MEKIRITPVATVGGFLIVVREFWFPVVPRCLMAAAVAVFWGAMTACGEPLEFPDWTVSVPEGARFIEYAHEPAEARAEWIELELDREIGNDGDGSIYRPFAIDADDSGRVYIADAGDHQVKVFGAEGELLRILGRQGQGPGQSRLSMLS